MPCSAPRLSPVVAGAMLGLGLAVAPPFLLPGTQMPVTGAQAETALPLPDPTDTQIDPDNPEAPQEPAADETMPGIDDTGTGVHDGSAPLDGVQVETQAETDAVPAPADTVQDRWLTNFGLTMLHDMAQDGAENRLISPLGLASVLAMLADGAQGVTAAAYAQGLGLPADAAIDAVAAHWQAMAGRDAGEPGVITLQGASGLWLAPDFTADPDYAARQQAALGAELATVDFADPSTLDQLNGWFNERTGGMIPQLLDDLPADTRIVLGNALYLNARWQTAFNTELTLPADFTADDGTVSEIQLMHQEDQFLYRAAADHQAALLPFADPDFALALYLPAEGVAPEALLPPGAALADPEGFRPRYGVVELPRLDLRAGGDMTATLRAMGMLEGDDHRGLTAEPLMIDQIVHQVALRLDETGAEAAAATAAIGVRSAQPDAFHLRADRPFVLAIMHWPSATPLFVGVIEHP